MNANLKGGNALVRFLLSHGEKIGMLGILICSGMIIWSGLGVDRLGERQTPDELNRKLKSADQKINDSSYEKYDEQERVVHAPLTQGEAEIKPIAFKNYPRPKYPYNGPILAPIALRTDPVLFPPEDLEVNGDYGLWASANPQVIERKRLAAMKEEERLQREEAEERKRLDGEGRDGRNPRKPRDPYGTGRDGRDAGRSRRPQKGPIVVQPSTGVKLQGYEDIKARSWVTVLARIPVEQQYMQYDDALQAARGYDPTIDLPLYGGYMVERAELTDSGQGEWKALPRIVAKTISEEIETYPVNVPDVIDPRVNHPILTHPLPPLILREWDERVSHSSMPLAEEIDSYDGAGDFEELEPELEDGNEDNLFGESEAARSPRRDPRRNARAPARRSRARSRVPAAPGGFGGGGFGDEGGLAGGGPGGRGGSGGGSRSLSTTFTWDQETSHLLLRFFDHSVAPGHRYRYRVRLILKDVNSGIEEKYLDKSVTERRATNSKSYRLTDWSKPSGIASVPLPARVYLMSAKPAKESNYTSESEVELLVKALNSEFAAEIAKSDSFIRGSVVNLYGEVKVIWSNDFDLEEDSDDFSMRTGITLLDFHGGKKMSSKNRDLLSPTRALLMDPAGKLFVQSELDDEEDVMEYESALEQDPKDRRGGFRSQGLGGGGSYEGF